MKKKEFKELPPPEQKVAAKALYNLGWSTRKIESWTGIDHATASRYAKLPTPEALQQFETEFQLAIKDQKAEALTMILKRIKELIPKEEKLDQLVKAGEFMEGSRTGLGIGVGVKLDSVDNSDRSITFVVATPQAKEELQKLYHEDTPGNVEEGEVVREPAKEPPEEDEEIIEYVDEHGNKIEHP